MTTVVLSEKPSVARDIARVLGASKRGQGCLEGNGYIVTWALGHLVQFAEPDEYGPPWKGRWSFEQLPMVPEKWKLKTSKSTSDQYQIVKKLITDAQTTAIICATDAGREGENIFRLIYEHARCKKPFQRLWVSSLTDEAIQAGFRALQDGADFDPLADAARARGQADWLMGMNLTRAYTVHNNVLCTIGRVQTPTLAMVVKRDDAIANFKKAYFYELVAQFEEGFAAKYSKDGQTRIEKKEEAERLHRELSPHKTGKVLKVEKKIKKHRPPALYDLNNLQRDANRRFGFTAAQVLEYAQALYETHKLITYPRTESRHISEDMVPELPGILQKLEHPQAEDALARLRAGHKLGKAYVDRTKLTDHHAIIPTGQRPSPNLSPALKKVYDLVVTRFVGVFLPDQVVEETTVTVDIGGATFVAKGSVVLEQGWKVVEPKRDQPEKKKNKDGEEEDPPQALPPLEQGQEVHVKSMDVVEKETKPPRPYTDATLLAAMKNAGREIEDDELASAMKESGLGTPATRAEMIEKLIRTGYVVREKKSILSTDKGKALVGLVAEPLRSPELTAEWEQRLKEVEEGQRPVAEFYDGIEAFVRELIPKVRQGPALSPEQAAQARAEQGGKKKGKGGRGSGKELAPCPKCKEGKVFENPKAYGCSRYREGCDFTIWKTVAKKKLSEKQVQMLIANGRSDKMKGFTSRAGKKFEARLKFDDDFKVVFEFDDGPRNGANGRAGAAKKSAGRPSSYRDSGPPPVSRDAGPPPMEGDPGPPPPVEGDPGPAGYISEAPPPSYGESAPPSASGQSASSPSSAQSAHAQRAPSPASARPASTSATLTCPKCNQGQIIEGQRGFGCNRYREGCDFVVWKQMAGKKLTEKQIQTLIAKGQTGLIKGFKSRKGSKFDARLKLDEGYKAAFDFAD